MIDRRAFLAAVGAAWPPLASDPASFLAGRSRVQGTDGEGGAFYWFNSVAISDAGHSLYGRFVYDLFLPLIAPKKLQGTNPWLVLCDGDCMTSVSNLRSYFREDDRAVLDEAARVGESLSYVLGVIGEGRSRTAIDGDLRRNGTLGYMGMTVPRQYSRDTFVSARQTMALVMAARIDGSNFKRINYEWHTNAQLRRFGFEVSA